MLTLEKDIEKKLVTLVERHGGRCLKWVCPGCSGVPDRICLLPGGRVVFVELKRPKGGRIAALQLWWQAVLTKLGFRCMVIKDAAGIHQLQDYIENPEEERI